MSYRIIENPNGFYTLSNSAGNLARTTGGEVYRTRSMLDASEARSYLDREFTGSILPNTHRLRSMFGKIGVSNLNAA